MRQLEIEQFRLVHTGDNVLFIGKMALNRSETLRSARA